MNRTLSHPDARAPRGGGTASAYALLDRFWSFGKAIPASRICCSPRSGFPAPCSPLGYGAILGMTGAALQAVFANPLASPDITGSSSGAALGAVFAAYWLGLTDPLALAASGAAGAMLALSILLAARRPPQRYVDVAACRARDCPCSGRGHEPVAGARPLAFRFLRQFRMADGQLRRPQPASGRRGACPRRDRLRPACPPIGRARRHRPGRGCRRLLRLSGAANIDRGGGAERDRGRRRDFGMRGGRFCRPDRALSWRGD